MRFILLSFLCLMLFGCGNNVDRGNVVGTYSINIRGVSDVIVLDAAGSYQHRYKAENGRDVVAKDTWQFETVEGGPTVTLHNFKSDVDGVNAQGEGYFLLKVTSSGRKCRLWVGVDRAIFYEQR